MSILEANTDNANNSDVLAVAFDALAGGAQTAGGRSPPFGGFSDLRVTPFRRTYPISSSLSSTIRQFPRCPK
jgi:hypothetical protein